MASMGTTDDDALYGVGAGTSSEPGSDHSDEGTSTQGYGLRSDNGIVVMPPPAIDGKGSAKGFKGNIGLMASVALIFNNITGPALVELPVVFQRSGWFAAFLMIIFTYMLCHMATNMMIEIMCCMPGNDRYQLRAEFSTCLKHYFGAESKTFKFIHIVLFFYLQSVNVAMIVQSSQMFDMLVVFVFGQSCGVEFFPPSVACANERHNITPFGNTCILSCGYAMTAVLSIPMAYLRLEENKEVQIGSFILVLVTVLIWSIAFLFHDADMDRVPAIGNDPSDLVGTILFSYAVVTTIPSWLSEKSKDVDVDIVVSQSLGWATFSYVAVGILGGWAYSFSGDQQLLQAINEKGPSALRVSVYLFPLLVNVPSIPIFSIISRYNLVDSGLCDERLALFLSVTFPWLFSVVAYKGDSMELLVNLSGIYFSGLVNFVIPFWMYYGLTTNRRARARRRSVLDGTDEAVPASVDELLELSEELPLLGSKGTSDDEAAQAGVNRGAAGGDADEWCGEIRVPALRDIEFAADAPNPGFNALPEPLREHAPEVALGCLAAFGLALLCDQLKYIRGS